MPKNRHHTGSQIFVSIQVSALPHRFVSCRLGEDTDIIAAQTLPITVMTRPFGRVLILAPAYEKQIGRHLLPEVKKWSCRAP